MSGLFFLISFFLLWIYLRLAPRWQQIDIPEARSSHSQPTVRGGGAVWLLAVIAMWGLGYMPGWPAVGVLFAGLTGLAADHEYMPPWTRLILYAMAWVFIFAGYQWFNFSWYWAIPLWLAALAWVNLFNFMDGINGMMTLYSLVLLGAFYLHPTLEPEHSLILAMGGSVAAYGIFNVRKKALLFAGDIGAIALACVLGILLLKLIARTEQWWYFLWVCVYLIDSGCTLIWRIVQKHRLFKPHRNHLYQYLANEMGWPAIAVSAAYASVQLLIIGLVHWVQIKAPTFLSVVTIVIIAMLCIGYIWARRWVHLHKPEVPAFDQ